MLLTKERPTIFVEGSPISQERLPMASAGTIEPDDGAAVVPPPATIK